MYSPSALDQERPSAEPSARLKGNLGTGGLLLTALALNAPLAMMAGFLPIQIGLGLGAATPLVFLVVMVLVLFFRDRPGLETSVWKTWTAPALAVLGFGYVVAQATLNSNVLIGGSSAVATSCILAVVAIAVAAMLYAAWLRTGRPHTWERIGEQDDRVVE